MIVLLLAASLSAQVPACVPSSQGYLPTPSPCRVVITDPRTGQPEALMLRMLAEPRPVKPGRWPLGDFYPNPRKRWIKMLLLALVL